MKSRIICLAPGRVAPGMTLAASVTALDGQVLLSAGTVLSPETLDRLIRRGIETVSVMLLDTRNEETIAMEILAVQSRVELIFRGSGSSAREELRSAIINYRLEQSQ
ncbi:MAG: hypothetical protein WCK63_09710 [Betaproteobacteria bacterium]